MFTLVSSLGLFDFASVVVAIFVLPPSPITFFIFFDEVVVVVVVDDCCRFAEFPSRRLENASPPKSTSLIAPVPPKVEVEFVEFEFEFE